MHRVRRRAHALFAASGAIAVVHTFFPCERRGFPFDEAFDRAAQQQSRAGMGSCLVLDTFRIRLQSSCVCVFVFMFILAFVFVVVLVAVSVSVSVCNAQIASCHVLGAMCYVPCAMCEVFVLVFAFVFVLVFVFVFVFSSSSSSSSSAPSSLSFSSSSTLSSSFCVWRGEHVMSLPSLSPARSGSQKALLVLCT